MINYNSSYIKNKKTKKKLQLLITKLDKNKSSNYLKENIPKQVQGKAIASDEQEGDLGGLSELSMQRSECHNPTVLSVHQQHQRPEAKAHQKRNEQLPLPFVLCFLRTCLPLHELINQLAALALTTFSSQRQNVGCLGLKQSLSS